MARVCVQEWQFKSSSSNATYTVKLWDDGRTSCDCRGWRFKREGQERSCKHVAKVEAARRPPTVFKPPISAAPRIDALNSRRPICPQCGKTDIQMYDGGLGYEAIRCRSCGMETDRNTGATSRWLPDRVKPRRASYVQCPQCGSANTRWIEDDDYSGLRCLDCNMETDTGTGEAYLRVPTNQRPVSRVDKPPKPDPPPPKGKRRIIIDDD